MHVRDVHLFRQYDVDLPLEDIKGEQEGQQQNMDTQEAETSEMVELATNEVSEQNPLPKMEQTASQKSTASFFGLFSGADRVDYVLMFFGSVGTCAHGAALPVFFVLFGRMIDSLGNLFKNPRQLSSHVSEVWHRGCRRGERLTAQLRVKYLESILKKDISFFDTEARDANILFHISSDAILVQDAIGDKTGHALHYLSQFIVGFAIGFASVWQLTLLTLAVVPLIAMAGGAYTVIMSTLSEKGEAAYAEAGKVAEEALSQVRTVYSFVGEDRAIEAYSMSLNKALKFAAPNLAAIAKGRAAGGNILSMIETDANSSDRSDSGILIPTVSGKIEFCEVCLAYPSRPDMVFQNLSFAISSGKTFAVVGPSGSGKSTIMSMVERFYEPTSGKILLDGHDLKTLQLKWLREQMGLVSQEPALFATTIIDNIFFGKEDANMDWIIEAAKAANAHSFIEELPNGYYTQVGEGGTQLSGGQKQRIAIARAVLTNPKILLLDEATSALDAESELIVQQALDKIRSNRTTIIVAHRLSTIRDVDMISLLCVLPTEMSWQGRELSWQVMRELATMLSNEVGWFDLEENNTGSLTSILAADATLVRSALADRLSTIVQNIALTVTAFVIAFILSWRIAAVVVASLPLLIGASITEDPAILLLDEATSALDVASERVVQEVPDMLMERRTTILVAHRLSSIQNADCIVVMQQGKVVQVGSHDELVGQTGSVYRQLVSSQQEHRSP
ncbi:ABC transporter B family member 13 [Morus notabilis]|uniref:ABC transporter B family member 13 n=1 Tax=Morus notabilis TaxID=981085 RepID=W9RMK4_9ROSA|nr:ABC transporter B family member 13 [Morus notabilis]